MSAPPPTPTPHAENRLVPVLGLFSAVTIVVGEVIGSGVFLKPNVIARDTGGYVGLILSLWVICGLINLCGALTLAELAAMMPHAGGNYVYLREAYGRVWGFLWCWAEFWVIRSGAIAALGTALSISLVQLLATYDRGFEPADQRLLEKAVAIGTIAMLAVVNIIGTRWGGAVQNVTTTIKAGFLAFLALLPFFAVRTHADEIGAVWPATFDASLAAGMGTALAGIMWAYDGWGQVTVIAEEIHHPKRNVPLALGLGVSLLIVLYTGANLGYHWTLPAAAIEKAPVPAVAVTEALWGEFGARLMLSVLMVSVFGAMNSNILVGPRVLFAVARDHHYLRPLRRVDPRFGTPAMAIGTLCLWAIMLILAGDLSPDPHKRLFDVLTDYAIFGGSLFYLAAVVAVYVMRVKRPDAPRPYRTWGYPWLPGIFVAFYIYFLASMLWASPWQCATGLSLIAAGLVAYAVMGRQAEHRHVDAP